MPHMMEQNETPVSFYPPMRGPMRGKMKLLRGVLERLNNHLCPKTFHKDNNIIACSVKLVNNNLRNNNILYSLKFAGL